MEIRGMKVKMENLRIDVIEGNQDVLSDYLLITDEFEAIPVKIEDNIVILPFMDNVALEGQEFILLSTNDLSVALEDAKNERVKLGIN